MLAFSVRLVDFVTGVSSLSGAAMAEEKEQSDAEMSAGMPKEMAEAEPVEKESMMGADKMPIPMDDIDWRDASEDDFEYSSTARGVYDDMVERRKKLDAREKQIMTREALLRAADQELDRKYQELSNLRTEIEDLLKQQSEEEKARIASLVKIYEGMKPKEAARIFDTLDLDVLVTVMSRMSERRLSPILANMNPERARTITIMLAEEKQLPDVLGSN